MPRYFFHVRDGTEYLDPDGTELAAVEDARRHSVQIAAQLLRSDNPEFWNGQDWQLEVADEAGTTLVTLRFQAIIEPPKG